MHVFSSQSWLRYWRCWPRIKTNLTPVWDNERLVRHISSHGGSGCLFFTFRTRRGSLGGAGGSHGETGKCWGQLPPLPSPAASSTPHFINLSLFLEIKNKQIIPTVALLWKRISYCKTRSLRPVREQIHSHQWVSNTVRRRGRGGGPAPTPVLKPKLLPHSWVCQGKVFSSFCPFHCSISVTGAVSTRELFPSSVFFTNETANGSVPVFPLLSTKRTEMATST